VATRTQEQAVRRYLDSLRNPESLLDKSRVNEIERKLKDNSLDVTQRLKLRDELRTLQDPSSAQEAAKDSFVEHAKAWAKDAGVSADAFREEGVPASVLREAGLLPKRGRSARRRTGAGSRRVSADTVREKIKNKRSTFTINSIVEETGASVGMVRTVVNEAEKAGEVRRQGTDPDHRGPGRAPTLYRKA
jgi:hypothetical protein